MRAIARIDRLADEPRPRDSVALKGKRRGYLRVRVGDYRVVYAVDDRARTVSIVNVGPRESIYD